ncbi:MAG TPA: STAS domain-containing protein, partial [Nannocystis exedens]|nr:STAS domain-containing protein [Nannocystis exedens]
GEYSATLEIPQDDPLHSLCDPLKALAGDLRRHQDDRLLFARGPVVVFRWRNEEAWPVEFVSENAADLTGYPVEEFASGQLHYASLIDPEDIARVTQEVVDNSKGDAEWFEHQPYRIHHRHGHILWVYDYTVVLRGADGEPTHFYGYIMDITERVEHEQQLERQKLEFQSAGAPIMQVWEGILAVPLVGLLTNKRAAAVMDSLLSRVAKSGARAAILDLTGVEILDRSTAHHLSTMVRAVALLGCECVLSGMSSGVAQIVVDLEIDFRGIRMFQTLQAALGGLIKRL